MENKFLLSLLAIGFARSSCIFAAINNEAMAKREKRKKSRGSAGNNRKLGEDFLEKNRRKEGVRETESGLQYLVLEEGGGCAHKELAVRGQV